MHSPCPHSFQSLLINKWLRPNAIHNYNYEKGKSSISMDIIRMAEIINYLLIFFCSNAWHLIKKYCDAAWDFFWGL